MGWDHVFDGFTAGIPAALVQLWPLWALFGVAFVVQIGLARLDRHESRRRPSARRYRRRRAG